MQLKEYLFYMDLNIEEFANMAGLTRQSVANIINTSPTTKRKNIKIDTAIRIAEATNGKVSVNEIVQELNRVKPVHPELKNVMNNKNTLENNNLKL